VDGFVASCEGPVFLYRPAVQGAICEGGMTVCWAGTSHKQAPSGTLRHLVMHLLPYCCDALCCRAGVDAISCPAECVMLAVLCWSPELLSIQRGRVARQLRTLQVRPVKVLPHECCQL